MKARISYPVSAECSGEFAQRAALLWKRLHEHDHYAPEQVFPPADVQWPGDTEGRILLAWVLLGEVEGTASPSIRKWLELFPEKRNAAGYFGTVFLPETLDEQQLSSHGWVLRALSELYRTTGSPEVLESGRRILRNLVLPLLGRYASYPTSDAARNASGEASGSRDRHVGDWQLSTDIGCAFILTDGIVQASEVFGADCDRLLDEMFDIFQRIDLEKVHAQTHASLTMARAMLRYHEITGKNRFLDSAHRIYELYRTAGMTEHYANDNWFGRPEWTEPCAIVDSFQCALRLAWTTESDEYFDDAHRIWFSAFLQAQRRNGGFGLDSCPHGSAEPMLYARREEAWWCCSMRAAEAFHEAAFRTVRNQDGILRIALPIPGVYHFEDGLTLRIETGYPNAQSASATILTQGKTPVKRVEFFFAGTGWTDRPSGEPYFPAKRPARDGSGETVWIGPVLTGTDEAGVRHRLGENWKSPEMKPEGKLRIVE